MLELLDTLSNIGVLGVPGVPGVPARFSAGFSGTPRKSLGVPGVPEHLAEHPEHLLEHQVTAHTTLINIDEHSEHREHHKASGIVQDWADALAHTDATCPPAGYDADLWRCLLADALWLCDRHGRAAAALGWTASDLFGFDAMPSWGGLADRLEGARKLVLTDRIAHWRGDDLEGWLWRETLRPMPLLWQA